MFHQFQVLEGYCDYLRFLWFEDNFDEPNEFRMTVPLSGASSSPGVANFGLKRIADEGKEKFGSKAATFTKEYFYVDDGLTSFETEKESIDLISNTIAICAESGIHLHKIASNSRKAMEAISTEERATDLQSLDLLRTSWKDHLVLYDK